MKTDNIYIAQLVYSTKVSQAVTLWDYVYGEGAKVDYDPVKYIVVKKQEKGCHAIGIDLKSKRKYSCELPVDKGKLYLAPSRMLPFELCYPDAPRHLPKKKILEMGNYAIKEIIKIENEKKK